MNATKVVKSFVPVRRAYSFIHGAYVQTEGRKTGRRLIVIYAVVVIVVYVPVSASAVNVRRTLTRGTYFINKRPTRCCRDVTIVQCSTRPVYCNSPMLCMKCIDCRLGCCASIHHVRRPSLCCCCVYYNQTLLYSLGTLDLWMLLNLMLCTMQFKQYSDFIHELFVRAIVCL